MTNEEFIRSVSLPGEEWRDVPGYEDVCAASSEGRIISKGRHVRSGYGTTKWKQPVLQKAHTNKEGYCVVNVCKQGRATPTLVHRLLALAFIPNPENKPQIDHIDGDRCNNQLSNLRWCTGSENMRNPHAVSKCCRINLGRKRPEKYNPVLRMKDGVVVKTYESTKFAKEDGFEESSVYQACTGKRKTYKGFVWMYLSDYEALVQYVKELYHPKLEPTPQQEREEIQASDNPSTSRRRR